MPLVKVTWLYYHRLSRHANFTTYITYLFEDSELGVEQRSMKLTFIYKLSNAQYYVRVIVWDIKGCWSACCNSCLNLEIVTRLLSWSDLQEDTARVKKRYHVHIIVYSTLQLETPINNSSLVLDYSSKHLDSICSIIYLH